MGDPHARGTGRLPEEAVPVIKDPNYVPPPRDPNRPGPYKVAEVIPLTGQLKEGHIDGFTVICDERAGPLGGTDSAPRPVELVSTVNEQPFDIEEAAPATG